MDERQGVETESYRSPAIDLGPLELGVARRPLVDLTLVTGPVRDERVVICEHLVVERDKVNILFDFDGTILKTHCLDRLSFYGALEGLLSSHQPAGAGCGPLLTEEMLPELNSAFGRSEFISAHNLLSLTSTKYPDVFAPVLPLWEENSEKLVMELSELRKDYARQYKESYPPAFVEGIGTLLRALRDAEKRMGLCTGTAHGMVLDLLRFRGLESYFPENLRVCAEHYHPQESKPEPHPYLCLLRRLGAEADKRSALAFEDSIGGALASFRAGIDVALNGDGRSHDELSELRQAATEALQALESSCPLDIGSPTMYIVPSWENVSVA